MSHMCCKKKQKLNTAILASKLRCVVVVVVVVGGGGGGGGVGVGVGVGVDGVVFCSVFR